MTEAAGARWVNPGLASDVKRLDRYDCTLAMLVTASGQDASTGLAQEALAQEQLGRAMRYGENIAGHATAAATTERAKTARLGLWSEVCG